MYSNENSDRESEYEDRSRDDSPVDVTKKCVSTAVGFKTEAENVDTQDMNTYMLRSTQSLTGNTDDLRICNDFHRMCLNSRGTGMCVPKGANLCPCGCLLRAAVPKYFRTREQSTLALHVVSTDILQHHGNIYDPSQVALFWKKDCRSFLWKGKSKASDKS